MKKVIGVAVLLALALLFLIPMGLRQNRAEPEPETLDTEELALTPSGRTVTVLQSDGQVVTLDLNEYLWGVVAAEMPADFEQEALKAQAVAARTYALNKAGRSTRHPQADLCTDHTCCQAWIAKDRAWANWGETYAIHNTNRITRAVTETNNEVILYDGAPIDAVFHSSSGENTQDAVEVWGNSVPYLQSVPSPEGEEVPNYHSEVTFAPADFKAKFLAAHPDAVLEGSPTTWIGDTVYSAGGSVHAVTIGGVTISGVDARSLFDLRSAAFTVTATEEAVTFQVTGFGHGVGMSQYGANAMAAEGDDYITILKHYYTGVTVEVWA